VAAQDGANLANSQEFQTLKQPLVNRSCCFQTHICIRAPTTWVWVFGRNLVRIRTKLPLDLFFV
jgi:hypothetical protein